MSVWIEFDPPEVNLTTAECVSGGCTVGPSRCGGGRSNPTVQALLIGPFSSVALKQDLAWGNSWHKFMVCGGKGGGGGVQAVFHPSFYFSQIIPTPWPLNEASRHRGGRRRGLGIINDSSEEMKPRKAASRSPGNNSPGFVLVGKPSTTGNSILHICFSILLSFSKLHPPHCSLLHIYFCIFHYQIIESLYLLSESKSLEPYEWVCG